MKNIYKYLLLLTFTFSASTVMATEMKENAPTTGITVMTDTGEAKVVKVEITEFMSSSMQQTDTYNPASEADDALNASAISE